MPLRAQVDGQWVVAPLVAPAVWRVLAADLRAGRRLATLPCCGGLAFGRTSTQGLAHFVHQRREGCATGRESLDHLRLKAVVARACADAGWTVETEVEGPDWRADVLATPQLPTTLDDLLGGHQRRQPWRVAIEVQLSRIDGPTLLARQARYARDRVRGCWLVGPSALGRRSAAGPADQDDVALVARLGLPAATPAFMLRVGDGEPAVGCGGRPVPLSEFVTVLLRGRVQFRPRLTPLDRPLRLRLYEAFCPACGGRCHPHLIAGTFLARCGAAGRLAWAGDADPTLPAPEFDPTVLAAARALAVGADGAGIWPCPVGPAGSAGRPAFHCPACGRALPASHLAHAAWPVRQGALPPTAEVALAAVPGLRCLTEQPHWCYASAGEGCVVEAALPVQAAPGYIE